MNFNFSSKVWGLFLLLVAAFILLNQFGGFFDISIGSIVIAGLALALLINIIQHSSITSLPIPFAILYIVFQNPLGLYYIRPWPLIIAAVLATVGLSALFPQRRRKKNIKIINTKIMHEPQYANSEIRIEEGGSGGDNNPSINVNFGSISRYLRTDRLQTLQLSCSFGSLEVFFDQVELAPEGAEVFVNCSFGSVEMFVPNNWRVVDNIGRTMGSVEVKKGLLSQEAKDAPVLTLSGNVSMGSVEVRYI